MSNEEGFEEIIPSNVMKDGVNSGFEEDKDHQEEAGSDNADVEDKDSGDEHLSNAASFNWDSDFMIKDSSEDEDGISKPIPMRKRRPFNALAYGRVNLEVGQLFKDLYHFRQVLRDFVVQEGFRLQRIKKDRNRYTTLCAFEGCSWRIHASPIEDKTTFMIKTLQDRRCC
ncbi:hypothetical protein LWI28_020981 [Acer negundo]|uniref:Transposase MuDR plant domain-containing protein n=1 Tax=Acer negundo TaxID=4023 RepID=A0AAD5NV84_ACENE|nr:hypothetical protein LWI28_020981 [Acer negundo]